MGGLADSLETLIIGRVIQALGVCAAAVLSRAIARDLFTGETLARALSLPMIATAAAPGFSPLVGRVLATTLGPQAGLASVLLGFLTMAAAAVTTWLGSVLPFPAATSLGGIQAVACLIAFALFALRCK